jgi:hypothetical protein
VAADPSAAEACSVAPRSTIIGATGSAGPMAGSRFTHQACCYVKSILDPHLILDPAVGVDFVWHWWLDLIRSIAPDELHNFTLSWPAQA